MYEERTYRQWVKREDLIVFEVIEEETDLLISSSTDLYSVARESVRKYRDQIKDYIRKNRNFLTTLEPLEVETDAPEIVKDMSRASTIAGVGPMAAVAGAIAEFVGRDLLKFSQDVIVENGGDIFIKTKEDRLIGVYAGKSPFSGKLGIKIRADRMPLGICTSSGTVGHSLSFGRADAAIIISKWTSLADAVATATGNMVKSQEDIQGAISFASSIEQIEGVIVIIGHNMGIWGDVEITKIMV